jgi:hypothetical protein
MERPLAASPSMIADRDRQPANASTIGGKVAREVMTWPATKARRPGGLKTLYLDIAEMSQ